MSASQSVFANPDETNYARLAHLILNEGTARLRQKCIDNLVSGATLVSALDNQRAIFDHLRNTNVIRKSQFDLLFPPQPPHEPLEDDIDMTLWIVLIRHLTKGSINWNNPNKDKIKVWQHYAVKLKDLRNEIFHLPSPELTMTKFKQLWGAAAFALRQLGTDGQTLDRYSKITLDQSQQENKIMKMRLQVLEEEHGICLQDAKRRKHLRSVIVMIVLVTIVVCVSFVVVLLYALRTKPSCSDNLTSFSTSRFKMDVLHNLFNMAT